MPIDPIRRPALLPIPGQSPTRPMFKTLGIASSGLSVQRQRMETFAQNIANADVPLSPDGRSYKRLDVIPEAANATNAMYPEIGGGIAGAGAGGVFGRDPFQVPRVSEDGVKPIIVPVLPDNAMAAGSPVGGAVAGPLQGEYGARVVGIAQDQGEGRKVYEPGHPFADKDGFVLYPDIDTTQELVKLLDAKRIYEANVSVFQTAKAILRASIDI
jgi:flagellar basal-body rod protein FlgC